MTITTVNRTHTTRPRVGQPLTYDFTDIHIDGLLVHTIKWVPALLRRLEREGWSREDFVSRIARKYGATSR